MSFQPRDRRNPYLLTWSLRGVIEDPHVRQLFGPELKALGEAYEVSLRKSKKSLPLDLLLLALTNSHSADVEAANQGTQGLQAQARGYPHDEP